MGRFRGKTRKTDLQRGNIQRHVDLYSPPKIAAPSVEDVARQMNIPVDQAKKAIITLIAAGLLKRSMVRGL